jgi:hypothetical protein
MFLGFLHSVEFSSLFLASFRTSCYVPAHLLCSDDAAML